MNINKEGICPECGSDIIEYGEIYWDDDSKIEQECHCHKCGNDFVEFYRTTYLYTEND